MENYSLLMGAAAVMKMAVEMAAVSMEKPSGGTSPGAGTEILSPRSGSRWRRLWKPRASMENYSLLMGAAMVMKMAVEMAAVSMDSLPGHFPAPAVPIRDPSPDLGLAMAAAPEGFRFTSV
ncbi:hypothetical protein QYE76_047500 [Lolium multiflorum]|uniref:Uncharacterized protein n=1 Tax=Lolium multiflorum TaxID=4521 RepID=A0AAD8TRY1_LOLMU|nr:hypothetical protein QYE76_047500 [Lolium multiflorum]